MTFKAAIVIDNWKLPIFERHLSQAGYGYTWTPSLTANCGVMTVKLERATQAASLQPIIQAAQNEAARSKP